MAENDDVIDEEVAEEIPATEEPAAEEAPRTFTQAELDAAISARLREAAEKSERERLRYEGEIAQREAYINGLRTNRAPVQEDPYADLSEDEKSLIRVSERANAGLHKKMEQFQQSIAQAVAPILAREQAVEFFETKGTVPPSVKAKTMHYLKTLGSQGVNMNGAYRLAMADYAEDLINGKVETPAAKPGAPARKPAAAPVPHVEVGGSRRSITPNPSAAKDEENLSWSEFRQKAEAVRKRAPSEGAVYGRNGAEDYRNYDE